METLTYPKVKSLKGLKAGVVYQTTNYALLSHPKYNRSEVKGFIDKKVNEFLSLIDKNLFMNDLQQINVSMDGQIFEGNHRFEALKEKKMPVPFMLYDSKRINGVSNEEFAKVLIAYNGVRSNWERSQVFDTAVLLGLPLAIKIVALLDDIHNSPTWKEVATKANFQPSKILGILAKNVTYIHGKKITLDVFQNPDYINAMDSAEFKDDLFFALNMMKVLTNPKLCNVEVRNVLENVLLSVWKGVVTKGKIHHYSAKFGFKFDVKPKKEVIMGRIYEYSTKPFPRKLETCL